MKLLKMPAQSSGALSQLVHADIHEHLVTNAFLAVAHSCATVYQSSHPVRASNQHVPQEKMQVHRRHATVFSCQNAFLDYAAHKSQSKGKTP
jgi:hypothetical protein